LRWLLAKNNRINCNNFLEKNGNVPHHLNLLLLT
jgi:hypothetical protein